MLYLGAISKMTEWYVCFQGKPFNITVIQVYAPTTNAKEAEVDRFYEDLQHLPELTPKKDILFIIGDWNAKAESQERYLEIPGVIGKFGLGVQNEAGLTEFCQKNTLVTENTLSQQHKRQLYTRTSPDGQYQNHTDYFLCSWRRRSSIQSAKTRPGADCGLDHQLLMAKFRFKLKKTGKTTRPFRYDLNQIPYTVVVVQSLSCVWLLATPWTAACQASPSFTIFQSLLKFISIESMMPSNHLSSVVPLSSCLQSFPASGSFLMSWLFASGSQNSSSITILLINIQDWFPLGWTG